MSEKSSQNVARVCAGHPANGSMEPVRHPAWCDVTRCTAAPASQANGYRPGVGGEHRSALIPINLPPITAPPVRGPATGWLTQGCAPWSCHIFLWMRVGELELSISVDYAKPALDALVTLLASAVEEVIR